MYEVRDGARMLRFQGEKLGESSSWHRHSPRWIEFTLYKTQGGSYVLTRVGVSLVFHASVCPLVTRYGLHETTPDALDMDAVACLECNPTFTEPLVYPEKYRYWTLVAEEPEAVLDALHKSDTHGVNYLTKVAERLLEQAANQDPQIDQLYRIQYIP